MRLIDADKLKRTEGMFQYQINDAFDRLSASAYRFEDVENTPTVEAIPIEWLKKHSWYGVIEHWEKDQKLNNSKDVLYSLLEDHGFNSYREYIDWAGAIMAIPRDDRLKFLEMERKNEENDSQAD